MLDLSFIDKLLYTICKRSVTIYNKEKSYFFGKSHKKRLRKEKKHPVPSCDLNLTFSWSTFTDCCRRTFVPSDS